MMNMRPADSALLVLCNSVVIIGFTTDKQIATCLTFGLTKSQTMCQEEELAWPWMEEPEEAGFTEE